MVRSCVSCCTLMEYTVTCSLVCALLLGLYPRGRKTAIFDVRVRLMRRMRGLVTDGYDAESRASFLLQNLPLLQLAFAEYVYNFVADFMPVEAECLGISASVSTSYATTCDQFRERFIKTGDEPWDTLSSSASTQMDRLIRNMRMTPVVANHHAARGGASMSVSMCTPSAPKKRRAQAAASLDSPHPGSPQPGSPQPGAALHDHVEMCCVGSTLQHTVQQHAVQNHTSYAHDAGSRVAPDDIVLPHSGLSAFGAARLELGHAVSQQEHISQLGAFSNWGVGNAGNYSHAWRSMASGRKPVMAVPASPIKAHLLDLHVCRAPDSLHRLYPLEDQQDLALLQTLHNRVGVSLLPVCIAAEQQASLERAFLTNTQRMSTARLLYICTSCAIGGKPNPLRPPMR